MSSPVVVLESVNSLFIRLDKRQRTRDRPTHQLTKTKRRCSLQFSSTAGQTARQSPTIFSSGVLRALGGKNSAEYRAYQDASPVHHVTSDDSPLLLIHGDADEEVPFRHAELLKDAATKAGVPVKLLRIRGGTHGNLRTPDGPDYLGSLGCYFSLVNTLSPPGRLIVI